MIELVDLRDGGSRDNQGFVLNSVVPQDSAGFSVSNAGDVNADGFDDFLIGAPVTDGFPAGTGQAYLLFGQPTISQDVNLFAMNAATGRTFVGIAAEDHAGFSVSSAGDINGDGFHDFLIGAPFADSALPGTGQAYLVFGGFTQTPALGGLDGTNGFLMRGLVQFDRAGFSVHTAGDVNGDGFDDLLVGAPSDEAGRPTAVGQAYLLFGKGTPFNPQVNLWELAGNEGFALSGLAAGDHLGTAVSTAGDINGDGFDDLIVGAPYADNTGTGSGSAYVVFGGPSMARGVNVLNGTNGFRLDGPIPFDRAGFSVSSAGDFNGDGFDDLLVGVPGDRDNPRDPFDAANPTGPGQAFVVYGKASGFSAAMNLSSLQATGAGFRILGIDGTVDFFDGVDYAGFSVSSAGDVDGDGFDDLLIGAPFVDTATETGVGEAYLIFGRSGGFPNGLILATLTDDQGIQLLGDQQLDRAGYSVSAAGDINGDGFDDLTIGAPAVFPYAGHAGRGYVLYGRDFRNKSPLTGDNQDNDLDGDGAANVIIGGQSDDTLNGGGGEDVLLGGQGDDLLAVGDPSFLKVDGGRGEDTLVLDGAGVRLDLSGIPNSRLQGIERIDLTRSAENELVLGNVREVLNLSDTSNRLIVHRGRDNVVEIGTGWSERAPQTIDGESFRVFEQGAATLLITNLPPELDLNGADALGIDFAAAFVEDSAPVAIVDSDLTVADEDRLLSATATITNLADGSNEALSVTVGGTGIQATYNSTTGRLTLQGSAAAAQYQQVLRTLSYQNTSQRPETSDRIITVRVNDGVLESPVATSTVTVQAVNDAPLLFLFPLPALSPIQEDTLDPPGDTVSTMIANGTITDPDGPLEEAIAVTAVNNTNGTWQYSTGSGWMDFGAVSNTQARLLGPDSRVRFVPNADFNGLVPLTFRAWDQTSGAIGQTADTQSNGGTTAFSSASVSATVRVLPINDAPMLDDTASPELTSISEDDVNSAGNTIASVILPGTVTDVDGPAFGSIAVISVDESNGQWEHSADGAAWSRIVASPSAALLMSQTRRVRFVPNQNFHGTASFQFRAWDESAGVDGGVADTSVHGGSSPFSTEVDTAEITVNAVDDPPTLDSLAPIVIPPSTTSLEVALTGITDGDEGLQPLTVTAVSDNHGVLPDPSVTYVPGESTGTLVLAPVDGESGVAKVTVTVAQEDGNSISRSFSAFVGANPRAWQNPIEHLDVDNNTFVVPLDALLIINELNLPRFVDQQRKLPLPPPTGTPPPYLDPSGDGFATALDVLLIVNFLNNPGGGEGEPPLRASAAPIAGPPSPLGVRAAPRQSAVPPTQLVSSASNSSNWTTEARPTPAISSPRLGGERARNRLFADYDSSEAALDWDDDLLRAVADTLRTQPRTS